RNNRIRVIMARDQSKRERELFEIERSKNKKIMNNLKQIPQFKSEDEEAQFWATHDFIEYHDISRKITAAFTHLKPSTQSITIRLPKPMVRLLKLLANEQDIPYQSLLKTFLDEKLKEKLMLKQKAAQL